jgi:hypothetical protein
MKPVIAKPQPGVRIGAAKASIQRQEFHIGPQ